MRLILASASPRRAEILRDAGYHFTVLSSAIDETPYPDESPQDLVQRLANAKGELAAARAVGPAILIAADTEVVLDGHIFGKPRSSDDARRMLEKLSGRTHAVLTGVCLVRLPDVQRISFVETTLVEFVPLSDEEIERSQVARLKAQRTRRDSARVESALAELQRRAATRENLLPAILAAVEAYATVGEISDALRRLFGEYQEAVVI